MGAQGDKKKGGGDALEQVRHVFKIKFWNPAYVEICVSQYEAACRRQSLAASTIRLKLIACKQPRTFSSLNKLELKFSARESPRISHPGDDPAPVTSSPWLEPRKLSYHPHPMPGYRGLFSQKRPVPACRHTQSSGPWPH